jgi:hypothetical protein
MEPADLQLLGRYATEAMLPQRCADRGTCAPFTTPALFCARVRATDKADVELLILNPSGRAGWLVVPWAIAIEAFHPTISDRMLVANLGDGEISPGTMGAAALQVAGTGLAGRAALRAAQANAGRPCPIDTAPLTRRVGQLLDFSQMLLDWQQSCGLEEDRKHTAMLATRVAAIARSASSLIAGMRSVASDASGSTTDAGNGEDALLALWQRTSWILDGWTLIACLWSAATGASQLQALRRVNALAPPMAAEALAWPGCTELGGIQDLRTSQSPARAVDRTLCEAALCDWLQAV